MMVVIGGYNSSNTCNLARIGVRPPAHLPRRRRGGAALPREIRHRQTTGQEIVSSGWLPPDGPLCVGLTAGASTPDNIVGLVIDRLSSFAGR